MTPDPLEDGDHPYETKGGAFYWQQRQEYPINGEHVYVDVYVFCSLHGLNICLHRESQH